MSIIYNHSTGTYLITVACNNVVLIHTTDTTTNTFRFKQPLGRVISKLHEITTLHALDDANLQNLLQTPSKYNRDKYQIQTIDEKVIAIDKQHWYYVTSEKKYPTDDKKGIVNYETRIIRVDLKHTDKIITLSIRNTMEMYGEKVFLYDSEESTCKSRFNRACALATILVTGNQDRDKPGFDPENKRKEISKALVTLCPESFN